MLQDRTWYHIVNQLYFYKIFYFNFFNLFFDFLIFIFNIEFPNINKCKEKNLLTPYAPVTKLHQLHFVNSSHASTTSNFYFFVHMFCWKCINIKEFFLKKRKIFFTASAHFLNFLIFCCRVVVYILYIFWILTSSDI